MKIHSTMASAALVGLVYLTGVSTPAWAQTADPVPVLTPTLDPAGQGGAQPATTATPVLVPARILGDPAAPVTIDEYASFTCSECAIWHTSVLPDLMSEYRQTGQVKLVYHDVVTQPVETSFAAGALGLCAPANRFFDVAQAFMAGLLEVVAGTKTGPQLYEAALAASGMTQAEMDTCIADPKILEQLKTQHRAAIAQGMRTYPVIRVNGQTIPNPTVEALRAAILEAASAPNVVPASADEAPSAP